MVEGGVAVFPADTLYGLACDPLNAAAVERIHGIKGRDEGKPSAVMYFSPLAMRELVCGLGPRAREAVGGAAPGPGDPGDRQSRASLSARLPRGPGAARRPVDRGPAGGRMTPIFQTSANRSGAAAPTRFDDIDQAPWPRRPRHRRRRVIGEPSTVVDITGIDGGGTWRVLREGAVPTAEVDRRLAAARDG